jgi:hypothetical protein
MNKALSGCLWVGVAAALSLLVGLQDSLPGLLIFEPLTTYAELRARFVHADRTLALILILLSATAGPLAVSAVRTGGWRFVRASARGAATGISASSFALAWACVTFRPFNVVVGLAFVVSIVLISSLCLRLERP